MKLARVVPSHVMDKKTGRTGAWPMKEDRELIALSKTKTLEALADHFKRPPEAILTKAKSLGLSLKRANKND
jgi:hypothetical protein